MKKPILLTAISLILVHCNSPKMETNLDIYSTEEVPFFNPFHFHIDPMERLLLVNFENDPDDQYVGLEPQLFSDPVNGEGLLVIAWRKNMKVEVYHEATLNPNPEKYNIAGEGLASMHQVTFAEKTFEINENGVQADIQFLDKDNRPIQISIRENNPKVRKPFGLLAPMGDAAKNPSAMPFVLLHDFYFVRKNKTDIQVKIGNREHEPDKLPIPMDFSWMYFARYSPDPFIVTFNPAFDGILSQRTTESKELVTTKNNDAFEIKSYSKAGDGHEIKIEFSPAFPQFNKLKSHTSVSGDFKISSHESTGSISGIYTIERLDEDISIKLHPTGGWNPKPEKLSLRVLYTVGKIFKNWPKTYIWEAKINQEGEAWHMQSEWRRER